MSLKRNWLGPDGLSPKAWLFRVGIGSTIAVIIGAQGVIPNEYKFVLFLSFIVGGLAVGLYQEDGRSAFVVGFVLGYLGYALGTLVGGGWLIYSWEASPELKVAGFIGIVLAALVFGFVGGGVTGMCAAFVPIARRSRRRQ